MPTVTLNLSATPGETVQSYWISVDDKRVKMTNDVGQIELQRPGKHILVWHFTGNEGATLGIKGEVDGQTVVQIKQSKIPAGEGAGAGIARFEI